ncbi:hypothetical protein BDR07DRAFT_1441777, partial [Suillus spraguei]
MIAVYEIVVKNLRQDFSWQAPKIQSRSFVQVCRFSDFVVLFRKLLTKVFYFIHGRIHEVKIWC